jgi:hypothetical protein
MKTRAFSIASALAALACASPIVWAAPPNNSISLDGQVNVGAEWQADESVALQTTLGSDFGPLQSMDEMFVTWNATNLYIGIRGNFSSTDANGVVVLIDVQPGAGSNPGPSGTDFLNDTNGATNAVISNANITFPANFRPDFAAAGFFQSLDRAKLAAEASNSDMAIYNVLDGAMYVEGSLNGQMVVGNVDGTLDDLELEIPWTDLYGGAPPANSSVGVLAFVTATSGFSSSVYLPALDGTAPINNPGNNNVSLFSDPGLSGFLSIPVTDGAGAFLTAVNETLDSAGGFSLAGVGQIFDADWLEVSFTSGVVLDANAATAGNYTLTDDMGASIGLSVMAASVGVNDQSKAYLQLSGAIPAGQAYRVEVTGVTANSGVPLNPATQQANNTGWRRVLMTYDALATDEVANSVNLQPFVRGGWDTFGRRDVLSDAADAFPNIAGDQSLDASNGDLIYTGVVFVTDLASQDFDFIINAEVPNTPGSDGGANQLLGVGYFVADEDDGFLDEVVRDLVLPAAATTFLHTDPIKNRRLLSNTTVNFRVTIPSSFASTAQLMASTVRLQGGTGLGGFSPEGMVEPLVTGGADKGIAMTFEGAVAGGTAYTTSVNFPAGALDVTEFRFVLQDTGGQLGGDFFEQDGNTAPPGGGAPPLDSVHLHVMRITEMDRTTPNHQDVNMFISSYDVPDVLGGSAVSNWEMYE